MRFIFLALAMAIILSGCKPAHTYEQISSASYVLCQAQNHNLFLFKQKEFSIVQADEQYFVIGPDKMAFPLYLCKPQKDVRVLKSGQWRFE